MSSAILIVCGRLENQRRVVMLRRAALLARQHFIDHRFKPVAQPLLKPFRGEFDRVSDLAGIAAQRHEILLVCQILPDDEQAAGLRHRHQVFHALSRIAHVVEHVDHRHEIEVVGPEREFLERMIIQNARRAAIHLGDKRELELHVGANERIGEDEMPEPAAVEHQAHIRVRAATDFEGIVHFWWQKIVAAKLLLPPGVVIVATILADEAQGEKRAPDVVFAELRPLALGVDPVRFLPLLSGLPVFRRGLIAIGRRHGMRRIAAHPDCVKGMLAVECAALLPIPHARHSHHHRARPRVSACRPARRRECARGDVDLRRTRGTLPARARVAG